MADLDPRNWTWDQWKAAGRHVATVSGSVVATLVAVHFIDPKQAADITGNLNTIFEGVTKVATGIAGLLAVLVPIYTSFKAANSASPKHQADATAKNLDSGTMVPDEKAKVVAAVAKLEEVQKIDLNKDAPDAVAIAQKTPDNVVLK